MTIMFLAFFLLFVFSSDTTSSFSSVSWCYSLFNRCFLAFPLCCFASSLRVFFIKISFYTYLQLYTQLFFLYLSLSINLSFFFSEILVGCTVRITPSLFSGYFQCFFTPHFSFFSTTFFFFAVSFHFSDWCSSPSLITFFFRFFLFFNLFPFVTLVSNSFFLLPFHDASLFVLPFFVFLFVLFNIFFSVLHASLSFPLDVY